MAINGGTPVRQEPFHPWPLTSAREAELVLQVLESGEWAGNGPMEREFTRRFAEFCGSLHACCVSNGSVAIEIALRAVGVKPGDEVIVPALTWNATAWAVVQVGAVPVFADVGESDWCLDPRSVEERVSDRTRAIIPVHLYHQVADMEALRRIADERGLYVIEDCAHAHGARLSGRGVGTLGHVGTFSFQQSKSMTSGEGGAVITNDGTLARRIRAITDCGIPPSVGGAAGFGGNYRLTELQAAVLLAQLDRMKDHLERKARNIAILEERLREIRGIAPVPIRGPVTRPALYALGLRYDRDAFGGLRRSLLLRALLAEGIPARTPFTVVYRSPLWTAGEQFIEWEAGADPRRCLGLDARCPKAEQISENEGVILYHEVFLGTEDDMADIAEGFAKVQRHLPELRLQMLNQRARDKAKQALGRLGRHL